MCCLFGILDHSNALPYAAKKYILKVLSEECEVRGTDATGISYNSHGTMKIYKRPVEASKLRLHPSHDAKVIMGHTRMTTKGNERRNYNNHPFIGYAGGVTFSLAHNGVLYNDEMLRKTYGLPDTKIETDSYIAVQLIEDAGRLDMDSIQQMAEAVHGTFCFTILNNRNEMYLVKGNNPLEMYDCGGYYIYASTDEILQNVFKRLRITGQKHIELKSETITQIHADGSMEARAFSMYDDMEEYCFGSNYHFNFPEVSDDSQIEQLMEYASFFGIDEEDILLLYDYGFDDVEIEELLYDPIAMQDIISEYRIFDRRMG